MRLLHQRNPSHQKPYHAKHNRNTRLFKTSEEYGICRDIKTQRAEQSCMGNKSQQKMWQKTHDTSTAVQGVEKSLAIRLMRRIFYWKVRNFVLPLSLKNAFCARLPSKMEMKWHSSKVLCQLWNVALWCHQILRRPRKVRLQCHQHFAMPQNDPPASPNTMRLLLVMLHSRHMFFFLCLLLSLTFSLCLFLPVACSCLTLSVTYSFVTISFCSFLSFLSLCPFLSVSFLVLLFFCYFYFCLFSCPTVMFFKSP